MAGFLLRLLVAATLTTMFAMRSLAQAPPALDRAALTHRLEAKREELGALQREVDQLTRLLGQEQIILCTIQRVEFEMAELQSSGVFPNVPGETEVQRYARLERELCKQAFVEQLEKRKIAIVNTMPLPLRPDGPTTFNEGGEYPVVKVDALDRVSVEFKKYGTNVELTGNVTEANRVRLWIKMNISELDDSRNKKAHGNVVHALTSRTLEHTYDMTAGASFVAWQPKPMKKAKQPRAVTDVAWIITPDLVVVPPDSLLSANRQLPTPGAYPSTDALPIKLRFKLVRINLDELPSHRAEHNLLQKVWGLGSEEQNLRPAFADTPQQAQQAIAALDKLVQQGVAQVLSNSVVQATLGQASYVEDVTGEFTYPAAAARTEKKKLGLFVDALVTPSREGRINVESHFWFHEADFEDTVGGLPRMRVEEAPVNAELLPGETCFWRGLTRTVAMETTDKRGRKSKEEARTQTVMLMTPELAQPTATQSAAPLPSNVRR